jgi:hypothetical protein
MGTLKFLMTVLPLRAAHKVTPHRGRSLFPVTHNGCTSCRDCGTKGLVEDCGSDDSRVDTRLQRYGVWGGKCTGMVCCGLTRAEDIALALIIDDGVSSRCHRLTMFNPRFSVMGLALGFHNTHNSICVLAFAESFQDHPLSQQRAIHKRVSVMLHPSTCPTSCQGCVDPLDFSEGIYALGKHWHDSCFRCHICHEILSQYTTDARYLSSCEPGKAYCLRCAERKLYRVCVQCNKELIRVVSSIDEQPYCRTCFLLKAPE